MSDQTFTSGVTVSAANWAQDINDYTYRSAPKWCGTAGGTADAITISAVSTNLAITAYLAGQSYIYKSGASVNTGAMTVAVDGLATKAIQKNGAAMVAGDHPANKWFRITYDGTAFQIEQVGQPTATKLDDFATPDDNTDLNANTTNHGLVVKATAPAAGLYNYVGITNGETAYTNKALFDATAPSTQALGDAAVVGTAAVAARRDHKHAMPTVAQADVTGLTTASSPQFAGINVGHATDTTITRVSAGVIAVEGATIATLGANTFTGTQTMSGKSIIDANASIAAHATTMDPWLLGNYVTLTGVAVTFTALANAPQAGAEVELYMNAAHVFTDGAVFEVDGNANYTAAIGDRVVLRAKSTTVFTVHPRKADGTAVVASAGTVPVFARVVRTAGNITTTSATLIDVTGATITFTTGAFPVLVGCSMTLRADAVGALIYFNIDVDGALELGTNGLEISPSTTGIGWNASFTHQTAALSAGSHTIKMQWKSDGTTIATILASTTTSFSFWAHEIR